MPDAAKLYLFVIAAALLLIVPGPNMAFVTSHALVHGWRSGVAAALGMLLALIALVFHCVLALCAATLRKRLNGGPALRRWGSYGFAGMMTALAARLLFLERPL